MSLHLDARQRAMLQEMGVTVWGPPPATEAATTAPQALMQPPKAAPALPVASQRTRPPAQTAPQPVAERAPAAPAAAAAAAAAGGPATPALRLHPAKALYPAADPAQTPASLGQGWLIVAEIANPADPLGGEAGRLLDNMLRAMQLHLHPRVFLAALERPAPGAEASTDTSAILAETVATLQPAMVLVLGHVAARAALGRTEPLGRLRAEPQQLAGCPAVVTYDPAFLLRSQEAHTTKAATWADLCRALATVRIASARG